MALANLRRLTSQAHHHRLPSLSFLSHSQISRPSSTKKVADRIVRLSAIDFQGKKHEVVGLSGQTLLKALINTGLIDPDSHRLEEIDACSAHCEVNIAQEWLDRLPPRSYDEEYVLKHNSRARVLNKHSRLGCQVLLDHDLQGGVVREAAVLGYHITPLFSYYAYHGPVFRVLLRLNRGKIHDSRHYGFIGYCHQCGNSHAFSWDQLGQISCSCSMSKKSTLVWEVRVVGWDVVSWDVVSYEAEFVPNAEDGYTVIVQKNRKIAPTDETVISNSFKVGEPGKVVLTIDNQTSKKKKLLYRSKTKPISE